MLLRCSVVCDGKNAGGFYTYTTTICSAYTIYIHTRTAHYTYIQLIISPLSHLPLIHPHLLQFDSVCQRLDPDRAGFLSTGSVARAFQQLLPLTDKLPPSEAISQQLFLFTVATDTLVSL